MGSGEESKAFISRNKNTLGVDRRTSGLRELYNHGILNHLYGAFLPGFLWPIILLCLVLNPLSGFFQGLPMCSHASLSQDGFRWRGLWVGWHHSLFYLQGTSLFLYSQKGLLDLRMRNMQSLTVWGSAIPLYLGVSVHRRQTPAVQPGAHLSSVPFLNANSLIWYNSEFKVSFQ